MISTFFNCEKYIVISYKLIFPYSNRYNIHLLNSAINRTNILYGGLDLKVTNVVFVHGSTDPWHVLGITKSPNRQMPAIYINGVYKWIKIFHVSFELKKINLIL